MAAVTQAPPRAAGGGFFGFLKDGVVVPMRNRGFFMPLVVLHAARSMAFHLAKTLAFRFFSSTVDLDAYDGVVDGTLLFALAGKFVAGHWRLVHAGVAYLATHVTLGLAIDAATISAAVAASCRGEGGHTTLASLLANANLRGPMVTALFGEAVRWALAGVGVSVVPAAHFSPGMAILVFLFQLMLFLFTFFYYDVVCAVAVVVSAAEEPGGLRAAAAVGRARRLMRGGRKLAQAMVYALAAWAVKKAAWKMHAATVALLPHSYGIAKATELFPLIVCLLLGALKVFCTVLL